MTGPAVRQGVQHRQGPTFVEVLRERTFSVLFAAQLQSLVGDQLARVAVSVLVFARTGSDVVTALTYALTFLPAIFGGVVLAPLGDRVSRRRVMLVIQSLRAVLLGLMAVPGAPVAAVVVLIALVAFVEPAFGAAEIGHLASVLSPAMFRAGNGLQMATGQVAQVAGFALGGFAVVIFTPHGALLIDAATFAVSALAIRFGLPTSVRRRPRPGPGHAVPVAAAGTGGASAVASWMWRTPAVRFAALFSCLAGFFVVPEGLAVPFVDQFSGSSGDVGVLLAAIPLGSAVGVLVVTRLVPTTARGTLSRWMVVCCGLPLVVPAFVHSLDVAFVCWFASGVLAAYQVEMMTVIARIPSDRIRSGVIGNASASLAGAQGLGLLASGVLSAHIGPAWAVAVAASIGAAAAVLLAITQYAGAERAAAVVMSH